jgi:ribosomal protein L28
LKNANDVYLLNHKKDAEKISTKRRFEINIKNTSKENNDEPIKTIFF